MEKWIISIMLVAVSGIAFTQAQQPKQAPGWRDPRGKGREVVVRAFLEARTVTLGDLSGYKAVGDALRAEIEEWGRYTIADKPEDADLAFYICRWHKPTEIGASDSSGDPGVPPPFQVAVPGATSCRLELEVNDGKEGTPLWASKHKRARFETAVHALVGELRAQLEAAERSQ